MTMRLHWILLQVVLISSLEYSLSDKDSRCEHNAYPPPEKFKVSSYDINLDLSPDQRWTQLAKDKANVIKGVIQSAKNLLNKYHMGFLIKVMDRVSFLNDRLPSPYKEEIKGIANAANMSVADVFILNIAYEVTALCTSIVAQDPSGKLYHVRNLDMGIAEGSLNNRSCPIGDALRAATVNINWKRGGKTLFQSTNYAGYIGILTAVKKGRFTFTINERQILDGGYIGLVKWILGGTGRFMGFVSRETMEKANSFDEAIHMLTSTELIAPAYFIVGGNSSGQGVVITRYLQVDKLDIWSMTDRTAGQWFIVETNSDHWLKPGVRRALARQCMEEMTNKNVTLGNLFNVLSSKPVKNECTTYTTLMQVDEGLLETWIRH